MTVGIVVFPGVEELDFVGPWEVFTSSAMLREQDGQEPDRVQLLAVTTDTLRCAKGLHIVPDTVLDDRARPDVVLVPGGHGVQPLLDDQALLTWLAAAAATATWTTSVCTGAFLLHAAGVTGDRRMATHRIAEDALAERGVEVVRGVRFVHDRGLVSSQGVSAGIDMALWLVGQMHGPDHARAVQRYIQYEPAPPYTAEA